MRATRVASCPSRPLPCPSPCPTCAPSPPIPTPLSSPLSPPSPVIPGFNASEAELQAWVRERLAAFKVPVRILFLPDTLPRNANGKILKKELSTLFEERPA